MNMNMHYVATMLEAQGTLHALHKTLKQGITMNMNMGNNATAGACKQTAEHKQATAM